MKLIIGLGNYPKEYNFTRHNVGFIFIDYFCNHMNFEPLLENKKMLCAGFCCGEIFDEKVILAKPNTYMNLSGDCVSKIMNFYKISPADLIVIHDDIDIDLGKIKITKSRNSAGHNGIKSINNFISEEYTRVRVGVGRPKENEFDIADYVLSKFTDDELSKINDICSNICDIVCDFIKNN